MGESRMHASPLIFRESSGRDVRNLTHRHRSGGIYRNYQSFLAGIKEDPEHAANHLQGFKNRLVSFCKRSGRPPCFLIKSEDIQLIEKMFPGEKELIYVLDDMRMQFSVNYATARIRLSER